MIGSDRKYPDAVYSAVGKHELGDTLTRRQIEAVLDAAGPLLLADDLDRQAAALDEQAEALGVARMGTPASGMVTVLLDLAEDARGRAAQLRVEGGEQG